MADRPILYSGPMIRALLDGRKTQTRRVLKPSSNRLIARTGGFTEKEWKRGAAIGGSDLQWTPCEAPRFRIGDRLWVRETWQTLQGFDHLKPSLLKRDALIGYLTGGAVTTGGKTRVSIHMPRWASRITLLVDDVRVQRLQDISEADSIAEGAASLTFDPDDGKFREGAAGSHRCGFAGLWNHLNGPDDWDANPWVVALTFRVVLANIDAPGAA